MVTFELLFLVSIGAGFVGAMTGMGGGVVLVPALTLLGIDIKHAIAVSMVAVIATSSGSAAAYVRDRITNLKVGMFLEMFTIIGAWLGATITLASGQRLLFVLFGLVLLAASATLFVQRRKGQRPVPVQDAFRAGWSCTEATKIWPCGVRSITKVYVPTWAARQCLAPVCSPVCWALVQGRSRC